LGLLGRGFEGGFCKKISQKGDFTKMGDSHLCMQFLLTVGTKGVLKGDFAKKF